MKVLKTKGTHKEHPNCVVAYVIHHFVEEGKIDVALFNSKGMPVATTLTLDECEDLEYDAQATTNFGPKILNIGQCPKKGCKGTLDMHRTDEIFCNVCHFQFFTGITPGGSGEN